MEHARVNSASPYLELLEDVAIPASSQSRGIARRECREM